MQSWYVKFVFVNYQKVEKMARSIAEDDVDSLRFLYMDGMRLSSLPLSVNIEIHG